MKAGDYPNFGTRGNITAGCYVHTHVYTSVYTCARIGDMKYTRKLIKLSSHSLALIIPKEIIRKFDWREKQKISIEEGLRKTLKLKDWKKR